ncbi:MAG: TylF/MycF/NovP-related O-methyltransferase [Nitrospirales bacterium]|nr:TylF/MycF/NovP-related O-methyltransferase [Nitrospirales bacterium]
MNIRKIETPGESIFSNFPPDFGIQDGTRKGRNVRDGYARGWGLQFGNLREKVLEDPLYQEACELTVGRSLVAEDKRMNLFLILKYFLPSIQFGHIIEFGSYRGGNALFMGYVVNQLYSGVKVLALDTYTGMPEVNVKLDAHSPGDFRDVDLKELRIFAGRRGVANVQFIPGLFEETAPGALSLIENIVLVHIDCDIYSAVAYAYESVKPYMVPGGYIVFDDATFSSCLGATEAVEELVIRRDGLHCEQIYPQFVFRAIPPWEQKVRPSLP